MSLPLEWMGAALRNNDLEVKKVKGWKTRGRPFTFEPRGVIFHHTASARTGGPAPCLGICTTGRADIPGPLCNLLVARDSTVFLVAAGYANHAGFGGPYRIIPKDSGNRFLIGVEVENNGIDEPWSKELRSTLDVVFATLLLEMKRGARWLIGHKEWAPDRKIDPGQLVMDPVRERVREQMKEMRKQAKG